MLVEVTVKTVISHMLKLLGRYMMVRVLYNVNVLSDSQVQKVSWNFGKVKKVKLFKKWFYMEFENN